jgi:hypothetical protein
MATTTNYSWTTPDDTDLVKDGAAAIRTLGSSVDTTVKALNPETTLGDISYRSSTANTNTRLGIGTTGQILTVAGGVPSWATAPAAGKSWTLLSTTSLSGATTTISSINQTYTDLDIRISGVTNATANGLFKVVPNNTEAFEVTAGVLDGNNAEQWTDYFRLTPSNILRTDSGNYFQIYISEYAAATYKPFEVNGAYMNQTSTKKGLNAAGAIRNTTAISSLVFSNAGGNLSTGTVLIYGVK